jgi:DNA-binding MarR family transcriptional regulator
MDKEQSISNLWRHLMDMNRQIKQTLRIMSEKANVSCSAMGVIFHLEHQPLMKMNDIADYLSITLGAATSLVDKLESQKWVERTRCTEDRRIVYVRLTEEGKRKLLAMRENYSRQATPIFEAISAEQLEELSSQLKLIEQCLSDYNRSFEKTE